MRFYLAYIIVFFLTLSACNTSIPEIDPSDPVLAEVFGNRLTLADIKPILQTESSTEDSIQFTHAIIEKWVRDAILMREAEKNIPEDLDIEKMVADYRSSLILLNYKQKLVHEKLDTFVSIEQLEKYYLEHSNQYKLDEPILNVIFLKVKRETSFSDQVDNLWRTKSYVEISELDQEEFELILKQSEGWYTWKNIKSLCPSSFWQYGNIKSKDPRSKNDGDYKYYIKVFDFVDKNQNPPLSYIEDQAKKVILHKRQTELIDNLMEELYVKYSKNNNVKINI